MKKTIIIVIISAALLLAGYFVYRPKSASVISDKQDGDSILDDPDLLYAKRVWGGLCANNQGEEGSCYFRIYLYLSGKLVAGSKWSDGEKEIINPAVEKELDKNSINSIIKQIRDSGVLNKSCVAKPVIDYSANYFINLDGIKKEVKFPACESEFNAIDKLIDAAAGK